MNTQCGVRQIRVPSVDMSFHARKAEVLRQLITMGVVAIEELIDLLRDRQRRVTEVAKGALLKLASENAGIAGTLLDKIAGYELPLSLLDDVSALPAGILRESEGKFIPLLSSRKPSIRCAAVRQLTGHWTSPEKAASLARLAIVDVDPAVRNEAIRALRSIENTGL